MLLSLFLTGFTLIAQANIPEPWPDYSSPTKLPMDINYKFDELPLAGNHKKEEAGWSDDYWASQRGSINRRWNAPGQPGFKLDSPSRSRALMMSPKELEMLAPSEKYDLWLGRYNYPLVSKVDGVANPRARDWAGICHGWAPASLHYAEPKPVALQNPDGVLVPFGASDIKALLSYYYAFYVEQQTFQIGLRCMVGPSMGRLQRGCNDDLNAGAFHVIIANRLGIAQTGFIADIDRYKEVWNQPIVGFESTVVERKGSRAIEVIKIKTSLKYVDESDPQWEPVLGTASAKTDAMELEYTIELNAQGEIVGGEWLTETRPDFLWFRDRVEFTDSFKELAELYKASRN
jgi:hypothetical protein